MEATLSKTCETSAKYLARKTLPSTKVKTCLPHSFRPSLSHIKANTENTIPCTPAKNLGLADGRLILGKSFRKLSPRLKFCCEQRTFKGQVS